MAGNTARHARPDLRACDDLSRKNAAHIQSSGEAPIAGEPCPERNAAFERVKFMAIGRGSAGLTGRVKRRI